MEKRILAGLKERPLAPSPLAEFVKEFRRELDRLRKAQVNERPNLERRLTETDARIRRIVVAISDGTDSPAMRQELMQLESLKVDLADSLAHAKEPRIVELHPQLPEIYRRKVEALESVLKENDAIGNEASTLVRSLIDQIVLRPGEKRGEMTIEVYGEPAAVLALATGDPAHAQLGMIKVVAEEGFEPPTQGL